MSLKASIVAGSRNAGEMAEPLHVCPLRIGRTHGFDDRDDAGPAFGTVLPCVS